MNQPLPFDVPSPEATLAPWPALPAAAVPVGAVVRRCIEDGIGATASMTVSRIHNAEPVAGRIRWETREFGDVVVPAAERVEVVSLP